MFISDYSDGAHRNRHYENLQVAIGVKFRLMSGGILTFKQHAFIIIEPDSLDACTSDDKSIRNCLIIKEKCTMQMFCW